MSRIELGPKTHAEEIADRVDLFRLAVQLLAESKWPEPPTVADVTRVAEYLEGV
ncbi:hypothetical protein GCM10009548_02020 [Streptomyces malaysiensis subsp. malaysiensis]|uniref:Uncharacterized protein n=1 Tax=Streptomyces malaysiensis TaxID=92644 RepID=A0ABX6W5P3_STRMQ|nr:MULTISPECIES: hypothetical protein [Streptomyces]QPI56333.1 hypothetical protein I1A49_16540 [Streptomyces solisilvae]UHH17820.1 hypothetical protein LUV23_16655 [Streptomyces sp. HNM0561]